jgi:DNA helicase-2/ATP-dependent DNA helicase PcrA
LANEHSIRQQLIKENKGTIPANVTIQPWFSFLLEHGVRPYRYWNKRVDGLKLTNEASGIKEIIKKDGKIIKVQWAEDENLYKHYFTDSMDVYSDKIAKLVIKCNEKSAGRVIHRLERIFRRIYIDEVQDMAGWDYEIIKLLLKSSICVTMVGDPRQTVYQTHIEKKYSSYSNGRIREFIQEKCKRICDIDERTLKDSHRNTTAICVLSSKLYPEYYEPRSLLERTNKHTGIFFVRECDVQSYGAMTAPLQLRYDSRKKMLLTTPAMNFGISKGLEVDHVLIYPTKKMLEWLNGGNNKLEFTIKAKLYVALTRAFFVLVLWLTMSSKLKHEKYVYGNHKIEKRLLNCCGTLRVPEWIIYDPDARRLRA